MAQRGMKPAGSDLLLFGVRLSPRMDPRMDPQMDANVSKGTGIETKPGIIISLAILVWEVAKWIIDRGSKQGKCFKSD
jgi:hypothetical protein